MGKVINLEEFKQSKDIEKDYLKFLSHVNKFVKIPTNIPELARTFYFTLRYLEGTVNCFSILSIVKQLPPDEVQQMKTMVINYLDALSDDLKKY